MKPMKNMTLWPCFQVSTPAESKQISQRRPSNPPHTNHPMANPPVPDGYTWSLGLLYLVWAIAVVMLYFPSRWYADLKARRSDWWLKYL